MLTGSRTMYPSSKGNEDVKKAKKRTENHQCFLGRKTMAWLRSEHALWEASLLSRDTQRNMHGNAKAFRLGETGGPMQLESMKIKHQMCQSVAWPTTKLGSMRLEK